MSQQQLSNREWFELHGDSREYMKRKAEEFESLKPLWDSWREYYDLWSANPDSEALKNAFDIQAKEFYAGIRKAEREKHENRHWRLRMRDWWKVRRYCYGWRLDLWIKTMRFKKTRDSGPVNWG